MVPHWPGALWLEKLSCVQPEESAAKNSLKPFFLHGDTPYLLRKRVGLVPLQLSPSAEYSPPPSESGLVLEPSGRNDPEWPTKPFPAIQGRLVALCQRGQ